MSTNCLPKNHKIIVTLNEIIHTSYYFFLPIVSVSVCASCDFQTCLLREFLYAIIFIMIIRIVSFQSLMKYRYWYRKTVYTIDASNSVRDVFLE